MTGTSARDGALARDRQTDILNPDAPGNPHHVLSRGSGANPTAETEELESEHEAQGYPVSARVCKIVLWHLGSLR